MNVGARSSSIVVARLIERSGRLGILTEILMLAVVAAMPFFFTTLVLKATVDAALFYSRASFSTVSDLPWPEAGASTVIVLPEFPVAPAPSPGETIAYTPRLATVEVDLVGDVNAYGRQVLGANLLSLPDGDGALVDVDTAQSMGIGVGGEVVLDLPAVGGAEAPRATVVGLIQPYSKVSSSRSTGLVVFPMGRVSPTFAQDSAALLPADAAPLARRYDVDDGSPARRREDIVSSFIAEFLNRDLLAAAGGVALFGAVLWLAVSGRVIGRARRRAMRSSAVLVALGARRSVVVPASLALPALQLAVGCVGGAVIVMLLIYPLALSHIVQMPTIVPPLGLYLILSAVAVGVAGASFHDALASGSLIESLTKDEE
jgi:hypothetical protein